MSDDIVERARTLLAQWHCELYRIRPSRDITRDQVKQWLDDYTAMIAASDAP